jgi:nucleotide-binding universal stress UspA family protein
VGRIVVGVDASPGAKRALAWAAAEARLRHAVLQVVHAYHSRELVAPVYFPSQHALPGTAAGAAGEPSEQEMTATLQDRAEFEEAFHGRAEQLLDTMLSELEETVSGVDVQRTVVEDRRRPRRWSSCRPTPTCWWSDPGGVEASPSCCWGR